MPSRQQTIADAVNIFQKSSYPTSLSAMSTWLGIYQTLLWYEPVNCVGYTTLPHIIDADKLRPTSIAKRDKQVHPNAWQRRAQDINAYLAQQMRCSTDDVDPKMDKLMRHPSYVGMQRQNTLGIAFAGLIKYVLEQFGSKSMLYDTEVQADAVFAGITFPGRSTTPRIDVLVKRNNIPCAVISAKWSVRHDRLNDLTNECPVYKSAYQRIFRQQGRSDLLYYVVTNEYDPARLTKMLDDSCIDGIVHIHKPGVISVCKLNGRLNMLMDLTDLIAATSSW
jgi:hypothetical protein